MLLLLPPALRNGSWTSGRKPVGRDLETEEADLSRWPPDPRSLNLPPEGGQGHILPDDKVSKEGKLTVVEVFHCEQNRTGGHFTYAATPSRCAPAPGTEALQGEPRDGLL